MHCVLVYSCIPLPGLEAAAPSLTKCTSLDLTGCTTLSRLLLPDATALRSIRWGEWLSMRCTCISLVVRQPTCGTGWQGGLNKLLNLFQHHARAHAVWLAAACCAKCFWPRRCSAS